MSISVTDEDNLVSSVTVLSKRAAKDRYLSKSVPRHAFSGHKAIQYDKNGRTLLILLI
jgi:hypothetical protein